MHLARFSGERECAINERTLRTLEEQKDFERHANRFLKVAGLVDKLVREK